MSITRLSKLGQCIHKLRESQGLSLEELAESTLLSAEQLEQIEKGIQQPNKITITLLGNTLNVYPEKLQNGEIQYKASQTELKKLIENTLNYLKKTEKDNKEIAEYIEELQEEYDIPQPKKQEKEKIEPIEKENEILSEEIPEKSTLGL